MGALTRDRLGYLGYQVGVAVLSSDTVKVDLFLEPNLAGREYEAGLALGRQIKSTRYEGEPNVLLMYDSGKERTTEGVALNSATLLLDGLSQALKGWPRAAGLGMFTDLAWNPTHQWFDDRIEQGAVMALVLSGGIRLDTIIIHGCKPASAYHTVTRAEGNTVYEIDGRPALEVIAELLGPDSDKSWEDYPLLVTLGVNRGDKFGELREEDYAPARPRAGARAGLAQPAARRAEPHPRAARRRAGGPARAPGTLQALLLPAARRADRGGRRRGPARESPPRGHGGLRRPPRLHRLRRERGARGADGGAPRVPHRDGPDHPALQRARSSASPGTA